MTTDPDEPAEQGRWGERERRLLLVQIEHHWHNTGSSPSYSGLGQPHFMNSAAIRHHCMQLERDGFLEIVREEYGKNRNGRAVARVVLHLTIKGREEAYRMRWRQMWR